MKPGANGAPHGSESGQIYALLPLSSRGEKGLRKCEECTERRSR